MWILGVKHKSEMFGEHEEKVKRFWGEHEGYDSIFEKILLVICTVWFFVQWFFVQLWIYTVLFER